MGQKDESGGAAPSAARCSALVEQVLDVAQAVGLEKATVLLQVHERKVVKVGRELEQGYSVATAELDSLELGDNWRAVAERDLARSARAGGPAATRPGAAPAAVSEGSGAGETPCRHLAIPPRVVLSLFGTIARRHLVKCRIRFGTIALTIRGSVVTKAAAATNVRNPAENIAETTALPYVDPGEREASGETVT